MGIDEVFNLVGALDLRGAGCRAGGFLLPQVLKKS
jgi:hypothetical protein